MDETLAARANTLAVIAFVLVGMASSALAQSSSHRDRLPSKQSNTTRDELPTSRHAQATESTEWITDTYAGRGCQFRYRIRVGRPDQVEILDDWQKQNISYVQIPQLSRFTPGGTILFNKAGTEALKSAWAEVEARGLLSLVVSWDGSYIARAIRGSQRLTSHSCGFAFDINYEANPLGGRPALEGQRGSVHKLVPIFERFGFVWGGRQSPRPDGSHFEYVANSADNQ